MARSKSKHKFRVGTKVTCVDVYNHSVVGIVQKKVYGYDISSEWGKGLCYIVDFSEGFVEKPDILWIYKEYPCFQAWLKKVKS